MTYIAVPISARTVSDAAAPAAAALSAGADAIELRSDYIENLTAHAARGLLRQTREAAPGIPLIVTCRDQRQGGAIDHSLQLRVDVLVGAIEAGADFVDIEYDNFIRPEVKSRLLSAMSGSRAARLILSAHDFKTRFENIGRLHRSILDAAPGAIPKLVYTAGHINDCFAALDLLRSAKGDTIAFCMGEAGLISRIITKKLGGFVTFAPLDVQTATAPGQLTVEELRGLYRWDSIDADSELYGSIGSPIAHSLSPLIHNACFGEAKMNKLYLPLLLAGGQDEFDTFMDNITSRPWLHFRGFSVTIPHKECALNYARKNGGDIDPLAEKIGAVNTVVIEGRLSAYNTDYAGAMQAINTGVGGGLKGLRAAVIGAGGAARAIVAGLVDAGAAVKIYNRTVERAKHLAADFKCEYAPLNSIHKLKEKLIVNCTSIGMNPHIDASPVDVGLLQKHMVVFDTVYNPPETLLLRRAREVGCTTISGVDMFVRQAAEQFKLFTGEAAKERTMRDGIARKLR